MKQFSYEVAVNQLQLGKDKKLNNEIRYDLNPVQTAHKGQHVSFRVPGKIRPSDKLFKLEKVNKKQI